MRWILLSLIIQFNASALTNNTDPQDDISQIFFQDVPSFHPQCRIGFIKGNSYSNSSRQRLSSCIARGFQDRNTLWKTLNDVEKSKSKSYDPLFDLFVTLTASSNKNITNILFLGDSVSSQFFFFMLCDFSYSQRFVVSPLRWMNRSCQFCLSYVDIWLPKYPHNILRLYNRQFNMPCIHDHHPGCLENEKMEQISAIYIHNLLQNLTDFISTTRNFPIFHQSMTLSEQTIVIFNYGLHILSAQIADWSLRGMIRGIFTFLSGQPKNVTFFYRETSSQVFASTYDGAYSNERPTVSASLFCCQYPQAILQGSNWRNQLIQKYFDEFDRNWRNKIGWISFYNISLQLYDLRAESHKPNIVDCTHFIYFPTAYVSLWKEIHQGYLHINSKFDRSIN